MDLLSVEQNIQRVFSNCEQKKKNKRVSFTESPQMLWLNTTNSNIIKLTQSSEIKILTNTKESHNSYNNNNNNISIEAFSSNQTRLIKWWRSIVKLFFQHSGFCIDVSFKRCCWGNTYKFWCRHPGSSNYQQHFVFYSPFPDYFNLNLEWINCTLTTHPYWRSIFIKWRSYWCGLDISCLVPWYPKVELHDLLFWRVFSHFHDDVYSS